MPVEAAEIDCRWFFLFLRPILQENVDVFLGYEFLLIIKDILLRIYALKSSKNTQILSLRYPVNSLQEKCATKFKYQNRTPLGIQKLAIPESHVFNIRFESVFCLQRR